MWVIGNVNLSAPICRDICHFGYVLALIAPRLATVNFIFRSRFSGRLFYASTDAAMSHRRGERCQLVLTVAVNEALK